MFPGGNIQPTSCFFCSRFRRETFALETQPWKGWSVIFPMCEAHAFAFAVVVAAAFAVVAAVDLAVAVPAQRVTSCEGRQPLA
jgi:hypothetical protein